MALGSSGSRLASAATACGWMTGCMVLRTLRTSVVGSGYSITRTQAKARKIRARRGSMVVFMIPGTREDAAGFAAAPLLTSATVAVSLRRTRTVTRLRRAAERLASGGYSHSMVLGGLLETS